MPEHTPAPKQTPAWVQSGNGVSPRQRWSFTVEAPLAGLQLASESGETFAADTAGTLYRLDRHGRLALLSRKFQEIQQFAWCATGTRGVVVDSSMQLFCLDRNFQVEWAIQLPVAVTAVCVAPYGGHIGVALMGGPVVVYQADRRQMCRFETASSLQHLQFFTSEQALLGATTNGFWGRYDLEEGRECWSEKLFSNIGDLAIAGDGHPLFTAMLTEGIRLFDSQGLPETAYQIAGTVHRLDCSFSGERLLAATREQHLYWLDAAGAVIWAVTVPDVVTHVCCEALGNGFLCGLSTGELLNLTWEPPKS